MKSMNDLMLNHLQDIYYAEKLVLKTLPKLAKAVESEELKAALLHHREQTQGQIERLTQVFEIIGKRPRAKTCAAMDGLKEESDEAIEEGEKGPVLDAGLLAGVQAVEHYEIARYGAMVAWAKHLDLPEAASLLQETLDEEKETDRLMNEIAERALNQEAAESGEPDEDDGEGEDESPEPEPEQKPAPKSRAKAKPAAKAKAAKPEPEPPAPAKRAPAKKPAAKRGK